MRLQIGAVRERERVWFQKKDSGEVHLGPNEEFWLEK